MCIRDSFYNNPQYDIPTDDAKLIEKYPEVCSPNIWPKEDLPELEDAFKDLGRLMVQIGTLVAQQCDKYVKQECPTFQPENYLEKIITDSRSCKARLLHYFAIDEDTTPRTRESWCGWHNDHGSLTGLCPAIFLTKEEKDGKLVYNIVPNPDKDAGLWVKSRDGKEFKVRVQGDCLAFQIGESAQINSGGIIMATPHAVQAIKYPESKGVSRETFAVFMQPDSEKVLVIPEGRSEKDCAIIGNRYTKGMNFGEFGAATVKMFTTGKFPI
eukprot:TRINITY_DN415_c0_g1_i5.p1 TRINITY_DN415_c0_g1~~TRINITY_DN415_c0_g1_i5.p1  ORF type:complete len:269 (+),score=54.58 TRINITY_DN415_c0_g1_i5:52-858(+)